MTHPETITPNDATDLIHATRAIYVGQTGNLRVRTTAADIVALS